MTAYMNNITTLIDIKYEKNLQIACLHEFGSIVSNSDNSFLSVPVINLSKPIIVKKSKNGYKLKLQWSVSFNGDKKLIANNFIVRCLALNLGQNDNDDEKSQRVPSSTSNVWKSLLFQIKAINDECTCFEAYDIDTIFLFDKAYKFRIEYHVMHPMNLLVASNVQMFEVLNRPPSSDKAQFIELEYVSNKGHSYEGHPKYLLSDNEAKIYRSQHNKNFDYLENDFIVFKLKRSGVARQYLPKAIVVRNCSGMQAVKRMRVSIGGSKDGNEWHKYEEIEVEEDSEEYQQFLLDGVDWKIVKDMRTQYIKLEFLTNYGEARGAQCRFKVKEFKLYGLEF